MNRIKLALVFSLTFLFISCSFLGSDSDSDSFLAEGTVIELGITTFQYGSHLLLSDDNELLYALTSLTYDLDDYVGEKVSVDGVLKEGYPVDGGPEFLLVTKIEKK